MEVLYALNNNEDIKSIPQVVIDGKLVGGYSEVETLIREIKSINRV